MTQEEQRRSLLSLILETFIWRKDFSLLPRHMLVRRKHTSSWGASRGNEMLSELKLKFSQSIRVKTWGWKVLKADEKSINRSTVSYLNL